MPKEIKDQFTDLKLSRQRKWALRNPTKVKAINTVYEASTKRKEAKKARYLKNKEVK